jgi:glutathione S-transferase
MGKSIHPHSSLSSRLTLPPSYVVLTATTSIAVGIFIMMRTGGYRKAAKIPYPQPYAFSNCNSADIDAATTASDKSTALNNYLFNCAQRAHGNFLENLPLFMPALLLAGLRYPTAAAVLGQIWNLGRVIYAVGYTSKEGKNGSGRLYGSVQYIGFLGLFGLLAKMGVDMVLA